MIETKKLYSRAIEFDSEGWRWPHFSVGELSCDCGKHCEGEYFHDPKFLDALEKMRDQVGPIQINSAHRCKAHNRAVGGVANSMHLRAIAVDIKISPHSRVELYEAAIKSGFKGMGFGVNFMHLDIGVRRRWTYPGALGLWKRALGFSPL
ncbi:MAG: peptidase M15A [Hyphomonadaceae bacterium]|nr:MAG: peptidase M15A [Hyphomonadaceae bacterium]KAF0183518.1 MAG: peptidase M15A [Hyphomonadaceae bacterium]